MKSILFLTSFVISQVAFAGGQEIKVGVNGMVCAFCAQGITKKLKAEPSVESVDVKLSDKIVKINLKDKQELPDERIKELLTDSGYTVDKIERAPASEPKK